MGKSGLHMRSDMRQNEAARKAVAPSQTISAGARHTIGRDSGDLADSPISTIESTPGTTSLEKRGETEPRRSGYGMSVTLSQGDDAWKLLQDAEFRSKWAELLAACPWSTAFQSSPFVLTWYESYGNEYNPLVVCGQGQTPGLLFLAVHRKTGEIAVAGAHQAEYQVWLADPTAAEAFIVAALDAVAARFPGRGLTFRYVPAGAPTDWARQGTAWARRCVLERWRRPVVRLDDTAFVNEYLAQKKKRRSTKSYYNQLRKVGDLEFIKLEGKEELCDVLDELIAYYDSRQMAMHGEAPFHEDPVKKRFHVAMMQQPGLLHTTLLKAGKRIVSAQFGIVSGKELILAMPIFSPFFADQSPITLHYLLLVEKAMADGYLVLDMTPGESGFKDRFATQHEFVHVVRVYFSVRSRRLFALKLGVEDAGRSILRRIGFSPAKLKERASLWKKEMERLKWHHLAQFATNRIRRIKRWIYSRDESRVYLVGKADAQRMQHSNLMRRDSLGDLIYFAPVEHWQDRQSFLRESLQRMERKHHCYTRVEEGRLVHFGWIEEKQEQAEFPEVRQKLSLPAGTAVLYDFYTDPGARGRGLYKAAMSQMLRDAAGTAGVERMMIAVLARNAPSRKAIEGLGFQYVFSLYRYVWLGRGRTSASVLPEGWNAAPSEQLNQDTKSVED